MKKIFITGGSGVLGKKLVEQLSMDYDVLAPSHTDCDILDFHNLKYRLDNYKPDIVLHLAAYVDTFGCEQDFEKALDVNVIGTINLVKSCKDIECKLVYISSEYVFGGDKGNYDISDRLDPINVYGKTKASAEYVVSTFNNYQIIRAPFIKHIYPEVFIDQYCSRYFLDEVTDKIIYNILNNNEKLIHIASSRKSLYEHYKEKNISVKPIKMSEKFNNIKIIPIDTSLKNNGVKYEKE